MPSSGLTIKDVARTAGVPLGTASNVIDLPDAALKQAILRAARLGIGVTDASKFSQTALVGVCSFDDVDMILTAGAPDPAIVAAVRESGVELRILS